LVEPLTEPLADSLAAAEVPVRVSVELTPEQFARWEALLEKLAKSGVTGDRAELLLDALACKLDELSSCMTVNKAGTAPRGAGRNEIPTRTSVPDSCSPVVPAPDSMPAEIPIADSVPAPTPAADPVRIPDRVPALAPAPFQIHVHRCPDCGKMEIGGRALGRADCERIACDAAISVPGQRNKKTIPPRVRRAVLARDRHRCRAPGCGRTRFLEVHHLKPRSCGGTNDQANLITLCAACHRLWHERSGGWDGRPAERR
jgi:hypothetical protein